MLSTGIRVSSTRSRIYMRISLVVVVLVILLATTFAVRAHIWHVSARTTLDIVRNTETKSEPTQNARLRVEVEDRVHSTGWL